MEKVNYSKCPLKKRPIFVPEQILEEGEFFVCDLDYNKNTNKTFSPQQKKDQLIYRQLRLSPAINPLPNNLSTISSTPRTSLDPTPSFGPVRIS